MPLAGDEGAIRKYAQEMESLKKKVCAAVVAAPLSGCSKEAVVENA